MLRALGKDIAVYGLADFALRFVGFAVFPLYARALTVEQYGVLALATTLTALVGLAANLGTNNAVQRFYWEPGHEREQQREFVSTGLVLLASTTVVAVALGIAVAAVLGDVLQTRYAIALVVVISALLAVLPDQVLQYSLDTVRLHLAPWRFVVISALRNLLSTALSLWFVLGLGLGVLGFFVGSLIAGVIAVPVALAVIRRDLGARVSLVRARQIFRFGHPFVFVGLAYWLLTSMDRWLLAELSDPVEVGVYSIGAKFAAAIFFLNAAFGQAWSPRALKMRRERDDYRQLYAAVGASWFFVLSWAGCALAIFAPELLTVLTPPEYHSAAFPTAVLAIGSVLYGTMQITAIGISISAKTYLFARAAWGVAALNFILNIVLIPLAGATGSAIATTISYAALTGLYLFWTQRLHPLPLEGAKFVYSIVCCCVGLLLAAFAVQGIVAQWVAVKVLFLAAILWFAVRLRVLQLSDLPVPHKN
jgi:O-antigen/teichoic acid export membrane protein